MRSVREDPEAATAADDAFLKWARAVEAWDAVKWVLARDPNVGVPLTEGSTLRAFTYVGGWAYEMPTIIVLYEVNAQYVTIKSAKFETAESPAGKA
jgi:hypothetical protein